MTSPDGVTWTMGTPQAGAWSRVAWGAGRFVAVTDFVADAGMVSDDGVTWSPATVPGGPWAGLTWGNGRFVAVAYNGTIAWSPDGLAWTTALGPDLTMPITRAWVRVTWGNGRFLAAASGDRIMISDDGATWTDATTPAPGLLPTGTTWGNGRFVMTTFDTPSTTARLYTSLDGIGWTQQAPTWQVPWWSMAYGAQGRFVAVGQAGSTARGLISIEPPYAASIPFAARSLPGGW